mgnify:CR=1 FL=1
MTNSIPIVIQEKSGNRGSADTSSGNGNKLVSTDAELISISGGANASVAGAGVAAPAERDMALNTPRFTWSPHALCRDDFNMTEAQLEKVKNMAPPANQLSCGSCWAISTLGVVGDNILVANGDKFGNRRPELSATYALLGGNQLCLDQNLNQTNCGTKGVLTWEQSQCAGGNPATLLSFISEYGVPGQACIDYSWCAKNPACNGTSTPLPGGEGAYTKLLCDIQGRKYNSDTMKCSAPAQEVSYVPGTNEVESKSSSGSPACYNTGDQPFFKIRFSGISKAIKDDGNTPNTDATTQNYSSTGVTSININDNNQKFYFGFVCHHLRQSGPTIGSFAVFGNFMSGTHADVSYIELGTGAVKPTQWKGIYLEQIDYPKRIANNEDNNKELAKCLKYCTYKQLEAHYKNPNPDFANARLVVSDVDGGVMGSYSSDKCTDKITNGFSQVYYFENGTQPPVKGKDSEAVAGGTSSDHYPYQLIGAHAVAVMGWGVETIDWPDVGDCTDGSIESCCSGKCCRKTVKFWYVRNSWTEGWGDNGYFKMAWYVSPEARRKGSVGNSYSQFDQQLLINTPAVHLKTPYACSLPRYSGMYLLSAFDENEAPIPFMSVDIKRQSNYKGKRIHADSWYENVSIESPFPVSSPIPRDESMCLPHTVTHIGGKTNNKSGSNKSTPVGSITSPQFFVRLYSNKPLFTAVVISFVLLLVLVFAIVRSAK